MLSVGRSNNSRQVPGLHVSSAEWGGCPPCCAYPREGGSYALVLRAAAGPEGFQPTPQNFPSGGPQPQDLHLQFIPLGSAVGLGTQVCTWRDILLTIKKVRMVLMPPALCGGRGQLFMKQGPCGCGLGVSTRVNLRSQVFEILGPSKGSSPGSGAGNRGSESGNGGIVPGTPVPPSCPPG